MGIRKQHVVYGITFLFPMLKANLDYPSTKKNEPIPSPMYLHRFCSNSDIYIQVSLYSLLLVQTYFIYTYNDFTSDGNNVLPLITCQHLLHYT